MPSGEKSFRKMMEKIGKYPKARGKHFRKFKAELRKTLQASDRMLIKEVPWYESMVRAALDSLPFRRTEALRIIDIGCGTGILSEKILSVYPRARLTCFDNSADMLKMATVKLFRYRKTFFCLGDLREFPYEGRYELIVSSLTFRSLSKDQKLAVYRRLFKSLARGGMFYNIDKIRPLPKELETMRAAGMRGIEVVWRGHGYAVCRAVKSR